MVRRKRAPIVLTERQIKNFWKCVVITDPDACWLWRGSHNPQGYGVYYVGGGKKPRRCYLAHRVAWFLTYGPAPDDAVSRHQCHNPACCNPNHILLGTPLENTADSIAVGNPPFGGGEPMRGVTGELHPASHYSDAQRAEAYRLRWQDGWTVWRIAEHFGCHVQSVTRWTRR